MNPPESPLRRSSSLVSSSDYHPASLFASTAHLIPSRRPSEAPTVVAAAEESPTGAVGVERFDMPKNRRQSDVASTSSSITRIDHAVRSNHPASPFIDSGKLKRHHESISLDITPASPAAHSLTPVVSPHTNTLPLPTPASVIANPKLSKPAIPRYLDARSASPIPDYIDTGVKGTPLPSRRGSLKGSLREDEQPSGYGLGSSIPRPGTAEQGLVANESREKDVPPRIATGKSWPPWKRQDGWSGWGRESIITANLVPALVMQAFSTGILDATTYADFRTFASNREPLLRAVGCLR